MTLGFLDALTLAVLPLLVPVAARAALEPAGCRVDDCTAKASKIEANCTDTATGQVTEDYVAAASGKVAQIRDKD